MNYESFTYPSIFVRLVAIFLHFSQLHFYLFVFALVECEEFASPLPIEFALAIVFVLVIETACTYLVVDNRSGLETVGENNVGVHGTNVDVVNQGCSH